MQAKNLIFSAMALAMLGGGEARGNEYFLYHPTQATRDQVADKGGEAVAVEEITVVRGDSLSRISRRSWGRGSYYPQILVFNKIANPDLIYPGQKLRIPLPPGPIAVTTAKPAARKAEPKPQPRELTTEVKPTLPATPAAETEPMVPGNVTPQTAETAEQALYARGASNYKAGNCRQAIKSFDRLLTDYPDSPLAADASLYRADCYLQLAGQ